MTSFSDITVVERFWIGGCRREVKIRMNVWTVHRRGVSVVERWPLVKVRLNLTFHGVVVTGCCFSSTGTKRTNKQ